jgi:uncharacterized protein (TIGR03089 family)
VETAGGVFQSFAAIAERQPGRYGDKPFLTWYDERQLDQRVELSFKTFDNWVAKTANLLVEELGAGPGDRVAAVLADHWQTVVVLAACWRVGAGVVAVDADAGAPALAAALAAGGVAAAFVREDRVAEAAGVLEAAPATPALVAITADLAGRSDHDLAAALNFTRVVPSMGDLFAAPADPPGEALRVVPAAPTGRAAGGGAANDPGPTGDPAGGGAAGSRDPASGEAGKGPTGYAAESEAAGSGDPAGGGVATMGELLGEAARVAGGTGLHDRDRLLSGLPLLTPAGAAAGLLAPFGSGAGVVLANAFDPARFWRRVADERVTVAALSPAQAAALLAAGPPPAELDRSRLRAVTCPREPVTEALRTGFKERLGVPMLPDG